MDPKILQKILAQLMANSALSKIMSGKISDIDGKIELVITGNSEQLDIEQVRLLLETFSESIGESQDGVESFDIKTITPNVITVIVNVGDDEQTKDSVSGQTETLKDAINKEWPW